MILADTSVWVDHFRRGDAILERALADAEIACHPFVIGELACGQIQRRREILSLLAALPHAPLVDHDEALGFVERHRLGGRGVGWIDVHLLASAALAGIPVWTRDRRLSSVARQLGLTADSG